MPHAAELLAACAVLEGEGLTTAFGHVTARVDGDRVLLTGSQGPGLVRSSEDLLTCSLDGTVLDGDPSARPGEVAIHLGLLRARPDVMSVCRFHGPALLAFGTLGRPLPATTGMGLFLGHEVPCFDTSTTVTTAAQGDALAACAGDAPAVLLRGFGAATVGSSVMEAVVRAWLLERSAAAYLAASAVGEPLVYDAAAAAPFLTGTGPAVTQVKRAWRWLRARNPVSLPE